MQSEIYFWNEDQTEIAWSAPGATVEARFLVALNLNRHGVDAGLEGRCREFVRRLNDKAGGGWPITPGTWLACGPDITCDNLFQLCHDVFEEEHHAYTVVSLESGEGLSYEPMEGMVYEIYPPGRAELPDFALLPLTARGGSS